MNNIEMVYEKINDVYAIVDCERVCVGIQVRKDGVTSLLTLSESKSKLERGEIIDKGYRFNMFMCVCVIYKGRLMDKRVVEIKFLNELDKLGYGIKSITF